MADRFYKVVDVDPVEGGFAVRLDARVIKTPKRHSLVLPNEALARQIAAEWEAISGEIDMGHLPLTRLAYGALDKSDEEQALARREIISYAGSDLVCYRAESPDGLVLRQQEVWQPLMDWAAMQIGLSLKATAGIVAIAQPETSLAALACHLSGLSRFELAGLHPAVAILGSAVIALALFQERLNGADAAAASLLDELWQEERWGHDEEAKARRLRLVSEVEALERYFKALKG